MPPTPKKSSKQTKPAKKVEEEPVEKELDVPKEPTEDEILEEEPISEEELELSDELSEDMKFGTLFEIETNLMKSFLDTFLKAKIKMFGIKTAGKMVYFLGIDESQSILILFGIDGLEPKFDNDMILSLEKSTNIRSYIDTLGESTTIEAQRDGAVLKSGKITHTVGIIAINDQITAGLNSVESIGQKKDEGASIYKVSTSEFNSLLTVVNKLDPETVVFVPVDKDLQTTAYQSDNVNKSEITLSVEEVKSGNKERCMVNPLYLKTLNILDGDFKLEIPKTDPIQFSQSTHMGKKDHAVDVLIIIASKEEGKPTAKSSKGKPSEEEKSEEEEIDELIEETEEEDSVLKE